MTNHRHSDRPDANWPFRDCFYRYCVCPQILYPQKYGIVYFYRFSLRSSVILYPYGASAAHTHFQYRPYYIYPYFQGILGLYLFLFLFKCLCGSNHRVLFRLSDLDLRELRTISNKCHYHVMRNLGSLVSITGQPSHNNAILGLFKSVRTSNTIFPHDVSIRLFKDGSL